MVTNWIDKDGNFLTKSYIQVGNKMIFNPTEQQLLDAGYTKFVPQPSEEDEVQQAKMQKLTEIDYYNSSINVNVFYLDQQEMWLEVQERQQLATQINAHEMLGRTEMTRYFNGVAYTFSLTQWKQMLAALELYAGDALNVTELHKAQVNTMNTAEQIEAFDITQGYPEILRFSAQ